MNRLQYRIVFNKRRGQLMAVAETTRSQSKQPGQGGGPARSEGPDAGGERRPRGSSHGRPSLPALSTAIGLAFMSTLVPAFIEAAQAQVKVDASAPKAQQPTVLNSANGTVQVNIQTPSAAGVSRNTYSQFDVSKGGVILNNSRTDTSTQIGGWVQANPWLAQGGARVILNEVNSSAPSQLKGYVEVAGQRADVVIANPSGIQVDGGGFINASGAVLTTGTTRFNADGSISGFAVQGGLIRVDGQGLDGSQADYTALLSRAVEINAGLWAKDARVQTGVKLMTADLSSAQSSNETLASVGVAPSYAIDSTVFGGIYAQRITLIGTEAGLGVRQAGQIIGGQLSLRADGWLENTGTIYAQEPDANGAPSLAMSSGQGVRNAGWMASGGSAAISAPRLEGLAGSVTAAGLAADGTMAAGSDALSLTASESNRQAGQLLASGRIKAQGPSVDVSGAQAQAQAISVDGTGSAGMVAAQGAVLVAADRIDLNGSASVDLTRAQLQGNLIAVSAPTLAADGTLLSAAGTLSLSTTRLSSVGATFAAGQLSLTATDADLRQAQWLQLGGDALSLNFKGAMNADGARIASNGATLSISAGQLSGIGASVEQYGAGTLELGAGTADLSGAQLWSAGALSVQARQLTLDGAALRAQSITAQAEGTLSQRGAVLGTTGRASLSADRIDSRNAQVSADGGIAIQAGTQLLNDAGVLQSAAGGITVSGQADIGNSAGLIVARGPVSVQGNSLVQQDGATIAGQEVTLHLQGAFQQGTGSGTSASGDLGIQAQSIAAQGQLSAGAVLSLGGRDRVALAGSVYGGRVAASSGGDLTVDGLFAAQGDLSATAARQLEGSRTATIAAGLSADGRVGTQGALALSAGAELGMHGQFLAADASFEAGRIDLAGVQGQTTGVMRLQSESAVVSEGAMLQAGSLSLKAQDWLHAGGQLAIGGAEDLTVALTGKLDNRQGAILVNSRTTSLAAQTLDNSGGRIVTSGNALQLQAQTLMNLRGTVTSAGSLQVATQELDNRDGELSGGAVEISGGQLNNTGSGLIASGQLLILQANALVNEGTLQSRADATITSTGALNNSGLIRATGSATIDSATLVQSGTAAAGAALKLRAETIDSSGTFAAGLQSDNTIGAAGDLSLSATQVLKHSGTILAAGSASLVGASLQLQGSQTQAARVSAQAGSGDLRLEGATMVAGRHLDLRAASLLGTEGAQLSGGSIELAAADWRNAEGSIGQTDASGYLTALIGGGLDNTGGRILGNGVALTLSAGQLANGDGLISQSGPVGGELRIDTGALSGAKGQILGNGGLTLNVAGVADLSQAAIQADRIAIHADHLTLQGGQVVAAKTVALTAIGALDNTGGLVQGGGPVTLQAATLANRDGQISGDGVTLRGGALDNTGHGLVTSTSALSAEFDRIDNAGTLQATGPLALNARVSLDNAGLIYAQGDARVDARDMTHTGWLGAQGQVSVQAGTLASSGTFVAGLNVDNTLAARGDLTLVATHLQHSGTAVAGGAFTASADSASLQGAQIQADSVTLKALAGDIDLNQASIAASHQLTLAANGQLDTSAAVVSGASIAIDAANWRHSGGRLAQTDGGGTFQVAVAGLLDNQGGRIGANATSASLVAGQLDNRNGEITHAGSGTLSVTAGELIGADGRIVSAGALLLTVSGAASLDRAWTQGGTVVLDAASLSQRQGQLLSLGNAALTVAGSFDNTGGLLQAAGEMRTRAGSMVNDDGHVEGSRVQLKVDGLLSNAGQGLVMASQSLDVEAGRLDNAGTLQSLGVAALNVAGAMGNAGTVYTQGAATVTVGGALTHGGLIAAQGALTVRADSIVSTGVFAAGLKPDSTLDAQGDLTLSATQTLQHSGLSQAAGSAAIDGASLLLQGSQTVAGGTVTLDARGGALRLDGALVSAQGLLGLHSANTLITEDAQFSGGSVDIAATDWRNAGGQISQTDAAGRFTATVDGKLDNAGGRIAANGSTLTLRAQRLDNAAGQIVHAGAETGEMRIDVSTLNGAGGAILGAGGLALNVGETADLSGALTQADQISVNAGTLKMGGGQLLAQTSAKLTVGGELDNSLGLIHSGGSLDINAGTLTNRDGQVDGRAVALSGGTVNNAGQGVIAAQGPLSVDVEMLRSAGSIQSGGDAGLRTTGAFDNSGVILAQGNAQVHADALTHTGTLAAQGSLAVSARTIASSGDLAAGLAADNRVAATGDLSLTATEQLQQSGAAIAGGSLTVSSAGLALQDGQFQAQMITMNALSGDIDLSRASLVASRQLALSAGGQLDTSSAVVSGASVAIDAANWHHAGGQLAQTDAAGALQATVAGLLDNQGGTIAANAAAVTLAASVLDNRDGSLIHAGSEALTLKVRQLDGSGGEILSDGALAVQASGAVVLDSAMTQAGSISLAAESLSHRGGQLFGQNGVELTVTGALDNTGGAVQSTKDLQVRAGSLDNRDGQLGGQALRFEVAGQLANGGQGLIVAGQTLAVSAGQLDNAGGLQSQAAMDLSVRGALRNAGTVYAGASLTVSAGDALTQTGLMAAGGNLSVQADSMASSGGFVAGLGPNSVLSATGDLTLRVAGVLQQSGQTLAAGTLVASGSSLQWQDARIQAQEASLTASAGDLGLNRATLVTSGALTLSSAGALDTRAATVDGASIGLVAQSWDNAGGALTQTDAAGKLDASVQGALENTGGSIAAAGRTLAISASSVDNSLGRVVHASGDATGSLRIDTGTLTGVGGQILGAQSVMLGVSGVADLRQAQTQGAQVEIDAASLQHQGGQLLSNGDLRLQMDGAIDNTGGAMAAAGDVDVRAAALANTAGQIGGHSVDLTLGSLTNGGQGLVGAQAALTIHADRIDNAGTLQSGGDTQLTVTGHLVNGGVVYAQGNASLGVGGTLSLGGTLAAQGALTVDAGAVSGSGSLAAGLRPDNTLAAQNAGQGVLTVRAAGTLQFSGEMLAAGSMTLSGQDLVLQDSRFDVGSASLRAFTGSLRLDRAVLDSRGDLALSSAGVLSTDSASLSGANVGVTAAHWSNAAGSLTQTGTAGQMTVAVDGTLANAGGHILAAGTGMSLNAQSIDNTGGVLMQAGSGALTVNTGTLTGSSGQILSNGAVVIAATGAVTLDGAQTQGQELTLSAGSLDHRGGNLISTGAAQLRIDGEIDNRGGTIASAGALDVQGGSLANGNGASGSGGLLQSDSALQAHFTGALDNQSGRLRSGAAMTVSAASIDNRAGSLGSDGSLTVSAAGALLNGAGSLLAQQNVSVDAGSIGNQQGQLGSLQGDLDLRSQGGIDNTQGTIQAGHTATLASFSLVNRQGQISAAATSIDTRGQALDNRGGQVLAAQSMTVDSGAFDNTGGLLQSLGDLSIQTHGAALTNALDASVATPSGIRALGTLAIDSGALLNEAGISTSGNAQVNASSLSNRADLSAVGLTLAVGSLLDNQGGRLIGTSSLVVSAQQVLNQGGLIYGGDSLVLTASERIDNTHTASTGQGIQGGKVTLGAQQLANASGQVLANGNLGLTIGQSLDNGGGTLGAGGAQTIGDGTTVSALSLNNAGGTIWSGGALGLNLGQLAGGVGGKISAGGSLSLSLLGDFSYGSGSQFQSAGDTVLSLTGNFSNQGTLRSGGTLAVTAATIDNGAAGELSGAATVLTASGTLSNRGLIDGDVVGLQASQVLNVGSGRVYGGDIVITGGRLVNGAEGGTSAVIAARRSLDAALTQDVSNTGGALIYADGDLRIAGTSLLNENSTIQASSTLVLQMSGDVVNRTVLQGVGSGLDSSAGTAVRTLQVQSFISSGGNMAITAANLTNSGATIEARGNLALSAGRIDNLNPYLMWRVNPNLSDPYVEINYATKPPMLYEVYVTNVPLNGQTADQVVKDWQAKHSNMKVEMTLVHGDEDPATVSQSLAANIIVGGTLQVQGTTITNDMSRVVGRDGVSIIAGTVNNIDHLVTVTDPNTGQSLPVKLVLPGTAQSFIPGTATPGDRAQAGSVGGGSGTSAQPAQSSGQVAPNGDAGLDTRTGHEAQSLQAAGAAQSGATVGAGWRSGSPLAAQAVEAAGSGSGAGPVQAGQRSASGVATKAIMSAQAGDTALSVQAGMRQTSGGAAAAAHGAQEVQGAQATAQWQDGDAVSAQAVSSAQGVNAPLSVRSDLRSGRSAVAQALGAAQAALSGASAQAQDQATAQAGTVGTSVAVAAQSPSRVQVVDPQGAKTSTSGKPLALSVQVKLTVPNNSLFKTHAEPSSNYLVETDPRFADYKNWLSSDFLLEALSLDPATTQKRLGDGFYEQQLVREQIGQLTGSSYLPGYTNEEDEYRSLLTNGATFAQEHQLVPGVALTAEQMSQLTSDLVWLVEQNVTLPDGTVQQALVPQVYLVPRDGDLLPSGALIAGDRVQMALSGSLNNDGSIRGDGANGVVQISAQDIANTGDVRGTTLALSAQGSLSSIGGQLVASGDMSLSAGQDIAIASTTRDRESSHGATTARSTVLDQIASLSAGGVMVLQAGGDVKLQAVQLSQGVPSTDGSTVQGTDGGILVQAGNDIVLGTLQTSSSRDTVYSATNYTKRSETQDVGTEILAQGSAVLKAGQDLTATAATISSEAGGISLAAGRDVQLLAGEANEVIEQMTQKKKSGFLSKKVTTTYSKTDETTALGTTVSGETVDIRAGQDIGLVGASVVSDLGTALQAGRDLSIVGATNELESEQFKETKKSGLMSGGGIGITIGKQSLAQATTTSSLSNVASTVASVSGDVTMVAGGAYQQVGSDVTAPAGDVTILAQSIDILESRNKQAQETETKFKQSGLTLAISVPGLPTAMGAVSAAEHATQTEDDRMKALAAATAISKAMQAQKEIMDFAKPVADGNAPKNVSVSLSVGSSQSSSAQTNTSDQAASSSVTAGQQLSLIATGGGTASNVTVRGSTVTGQDVLIQADNAIQLLAASNTSEQHSKDSSSSASLGVGITLGQTNSLGFTASGSVSKGNADGTDLSHTSTQVLGGSSVTLQSGGDTALIGAVVTAPQVQADIGGNLKIQSLQDTAIFDSKSKSVGGSVTLGYGAGASGSFSQSTVNADYAAVGEQAGIRAGDGGFQVNVRGNTELIGGAITSAQAAIDAAKNSFSTGTLTASDIDNKSQYSASAVMVSAGTSGGMAGAFKDSGDERSTTKSTISAGNTTIAGGDAASQAVLDKLDRGATSDATAGKLAQGWDGQDLAQQVKLNAQIVAEFGAQASKEAAGLLDKKARELRAQGEEEEAKKYEEGGEYRIAAHAVIGALSGDLSGALGAAASASMANRLNDLQSVLEKKLVSAGFGPDENGNNDWASGLAKLATGALASGIGAAAGGGVEGAAAGLNEDFNNRQLHRMETIRLDALKEGKTKQEQERLDAAACYLARCADGVPDSDVNKAQLVAMQKAGASYALEQSQLKGTGEFQYSSLDSVRDAITRNGEFTQRAGGLVNLGAGSFGTVSGLAITGTSALGCPATAISCAGVPLGGFITVTSYNQAQEGNKALWGGYTSTEGQRVLASFSPATYPGERDPLLSAAAEAGKTVLIAWAAKYIPKGLAAAEEAAAGPVVGKAIGGGLSDGSSGALNAPRAVEYIPSGSVVLQPKGSPLCGPATCNMVINDSKGNAVDLNQIVDQFPGVRASGVNINEMNTVLAQNGVVGKTTTTLSVDQLNVALANGQPVIVGVPAGTGNHFIIVDGMRTIDNVLYYMTRDPYVGPRGVRSDILTNAINANGNAIIVSK